jgi:hypothetical protein
MSAQCSRQETTSESAGLAQRTFLMTNMALGVRTEKTALTKRSISIALKPLS